MQGKQMQSNEQPFACPVDCPNRKGKHLGKGYSYLFAILLTFLLVWQSSSLSFNKGEGWVFKTKEIPMVVLLPWIFLIGGALGINTDPIAEKLSDFLSKSSD